MRTLRIIEHISLDGVIKHSADEPSSPMADALSGSSTLTSPLLEIG
jgi:hypothetical protein